MSSCGPACRKLNRRQHAFHLLILSKSLPDGPSSDAECYEQAGYSVNMTRERIAGNASRLISNDKIQAAISYHLDQESKLYAIRKAEAVDILSRIATGSRADHFASIEERARELDGQLVVSEDVRIKLFQDVNPAHMPALAGIDQKADGSISVKLRDPTQAIGMLSKMLGWDEPKKVEIDGLADLAAKLRGDG